MLVWASWDLWSILDITVYNVCMYNLVYNCIQCMYVCIGHLIACTLMKTNVESA